MAEESGTGLRGPSAAGVPGEGLGVADGLIAGNKSAALPAPMSWLETPLRFGIGPSGSAPSGTTTAGGELAGDVAGEAGEAGEAVTATVAAADGGVHVCVVTMLAVAVSFTEVTEVALATTGICALSETGCLSDTELTLQLAVPAPLAQPLVNVGF